MEGVYGSRKSPIRSLSVGVPRSGDHEGQCDSLWRRPRVESGDPLDGSHKNTERRRRSGMSIVVRDERLARRIGHKQDGALIERASDDEVGDADGGVAGAGSALLRRSLRAADVVALAVAWALTQLLWPTPASSLGVLLLVGLVPFVAAGCWLIATQRLYLARVATMRTVEQAGLARVGAVLAAGAAAVDGIRGVEIVPARILAVGAFSFICLSVARTIYRAWLTAARRAGRFTRPVADRGHRRSDRGDLRGHHRSSGARVRSCRGGRLAGRGRARRPRRAVGRRAGPADEGGPRGRRDRRDRVVHRGRSRPRSTTSRAPSSSSAATST